MVGADARWQWAITRKFAESQCLNPAFGPQPTVEIPSSFFLVSACMRFV